MSIAQAIPEVVPIQVPVSKVPVPDPPHDADGIEVTVVMPCLNEARTVGVCAEKALRALERLGVRGEVVVADNGSSDGSPEMTPAHEGSYLPRSLPKRQNKTQ